MQSAHHKTDNVLPTIAHASIKDKPGRGQGLFARKRLPANHLLCILDGQWLEPEEYERLKSSESAPFIEYNQHRGLILARAHRTHFSFINEAGQGANVAITQDGYGPLMLRTLTEIAEGEEILIRKG